MIFNKIYETNLYGNQTDKSDEVVDKLNLQHRSSISHKIFTMGTLWMLHSKRLLSEDYFEHFCKQNYNSVTKCDF